MEKLFNLKAGGKTPAVKWKTVRFPFSDKENHEDIGP